MSLPGDIESWFGQAINNYSEPWYRFGRILSLIDRHVAIPPRARWLDVGCQIGQFIKFLQARHPVVATGIDDFDAADAVEVCRRYFHIEIRTPGEAIDGSWRYLCRRVDQVGFVVDEKFSFISALEILEHMVDTDAFLEECRAHLEDGGHLVLSTPNINSLRNRVQVPFGAYPNGLEYRTLIHHVRLYNVPILKSHLAEHGFELVAMSGVNFLPIRFMKYKAVRALDARLADHFPSLCGNIIAIFNAMPQGKFPEGKPKDL